MMAMSNDVDPPVEILVSLEFRRNRKALRKRYRNLDSDLKPVLQQLEAGEILGQQIPGIDYPVFKVRVPNRDSQKGKSGGYRFIYYLRTTTKILLVSLYSKSDQVDIMAETIVDIIQQWEVEQN
jgi:mRNA-degrading endonuclease RelE of RelBE toxin-antitoxin system